MTRLTKPVVTLALIGASTMLLPAPAEARTKDIVKYGAIGLGAAYLYNAGQRSAYRGGYYGGYHGGYYPRRSYYPSYYGGHHGGYYGGGYHGGCHYY
ncbi:MAG: hypothetical protein ACR2IE_13950 [Candidatus Sumerlaeaceae bacterium]